MEKIKTNLAVVGTGPGGQNAAIQAAKLGYTVVIIERDDHPGGSCLNSGTIPSKTLREAIVDLTRFHDRSFYGAEMLVPKISIHDLMFRLRRVLEEEREILVRRFHKNHIRLLQGEAHFIDGQRLGVRANGEELYEIEADQIVLATGSKPRNPIHVPFDDEVILDSTRLLSIDRVPKTMLVLGGGIIGTEYASFFAALGTHVTVIDKRGHILPNLDREIGIHLQTYLADLGMEFAGHQVPQQIYREGDRAIVVCEGGSRFEAEVLLYAMGRTANVDSLEIDKAGLSIDETGYIPVNALFQTAVPNIFAVGDVIGAPALASTSKEQGRLAVRHAFGEEAHEFPKIYPIGIYSIPEVSCVGLTEDQLQELGYRYEVGRAYYYEIARGHISGSLIGMFKIIFHYETLEVLGVHIVGRNATELIHIGQVAMTFNARIDYFIQQVFNYPTFAEGYRIAALNGYNKVVHSNHERS
jgi:NAD(P) transhydrogenase